MTRIIPYELIKHLEWTPGQDLPEEKTPRQLVPSEQKDFNLDNLVNNGQAFYDGDLPTALRNAYAHATEEGVVASMPSLIAGKAQADKENYLWENWFTVLSEEDVGIDREGKFASRGEPVIVTVHGGGILTPDRIQQAYDEGLTDYRAAKFTDEEFGNLLNGTLPDEENIELCHLDDVRLGRISNPFGKYGVVMDFEEGKATKSGYHKKDGFMKNPLVHARVGTLEHLEPYFDKAKDSEGDVGNYHRLQEIDPNQQQGRLLFLNYDCGGLNGNDDLDFDGRFVGVAPEARSARE
ncbi:MAG: hypothetical protein CMH62_01360 [Nanoarchaeota archaeon]|jgi:hypothetical protein|nr:hypothetical protein [Nanoarchaeota archaeon]|tara:strand:+ start:1022 stop:1903 length:882 start_codon:yes stop_codon:yes gene_type:complete